MSREPRVQFTESGTVVGEVCKDTNGDLVLEETESGEEVRLTSSGFTVDVVNYTAKSSVPSSPSEGDVYLDDGTNTSSGNYALRVYNGTSWVDQN